MLCVIDTWCFRYKLDREVENICLMLMACLQGNSQSMSTHFPAIVDSLMKLNHSALAAPRITTLFISLRDAVFDDSLKDLGKEEIM